ncbi:hypothetical protein [Streptomyces sp. NPDC047928]|uniref:hypothetical protein n=1 Tax=unclassified Streptomyces TaxID=2593676 RepID=UPI0037235D47
MHPKGLMSALGVATLTTLSLIAGPVPASAAAEDEPKALADLATTYEATHRYRSVERAVEDGYEPMRGCISRAEGGMGYHYVNTARNNSTDPAKPAALFYEKAEDGSLRLLGVEWFVEDADQKVETDDDRPTMFGQPFLGPTPGVEEGVAVHYDLHVWLYKHNPNGLFTEWNPDVRCPETD